MVGGNCEATDDCCWEREKNCLQSKPMAEGRKYTVCTPRTYQAGRTLDWYVCTPSMTPWRASPLESKMKSASLQIYFFMTHHYNNNKRFIRWHLLILPCSVWKDTATKPLGHSENVYLLTGTAEFTASNTASLAAVAVLGLIRRDSFSLFVRDRMEQIIICTSFFRRGAKESRRGVVFLFDSKSFRIRFPFFRGSKTRSDESPSTPIIDTEWPSHWR